GGRTWMRRRPGIGPGSRIQGVAYGGGRYLALGRETNGLPFSLTSFDGVSWERQAVGLGPIFRLNPHYDGSLFYLLHNQYYFAYSADGVTWNDALVTGTERLVAVIYGAGRYVAVSGATAYMSTDRINWIPSPSQSQDTLFGITFGNGRFVAV